MLRETYPYCVAGEAIDANADLVVTNKWTGEPATRVARARPDAIDEAIGLASAAQRELKRWPAYRRRDVCEHAMNGIEARRDDFARAIAIEAGKPIVAARAEVARAMDTFRIAMEEATRLEGRHETLQISERGAGCESVWKRVPVGPCSFITPFNFPLNLVVHKVGPALAAGCAWVLKPAPRTPVSALMLAEILAETDLPRGAFSVLPCANEDADAFTTDERLKLLSFTGSDKVGWALKARAGKKRVVLELGGNAACIVDADADLEHAAERIVKGAFAQSGQTCISVQRIVIHEGVYDALVAKLVDTIGALKAGDPLDDDTFLGPMISEEDAERIESWVREAVNAGARVIVGGERSGRVYDATLVEDVPVDQKLASEEAFAPVVTLSKFRDFDAALDAVNDSRFGLQAGVFTNTLEHAFRAFDELEVGGVIINDVPSFRVDSMPYGGVKDSGLGREGVRFAMEDMTEIRLMVMNRVGR